MAEFRRAGQKRVNAFLVENHYLFKHYFEERPVFSAIDHFYNHYEYRFEVPTSQFPGVRDTLDEHGYALIPVDSVPEYGVVKRKYTNHPRVLFEGSVFHRSIGRFNCFIMKDIATVRKAIDQGATRLTETDLELTL